MSRGRCAGCGYENPSCKKVTAHTHTCTDFLALYRSNPEKALRPEEEMRRYRAVQSTDEARVAHEEQIFQRDLGWKAMGDRRVAANIERWSERARTHRRAHADIRPVPMPPDGRVAPDDGSPGRRTATEWFQSFG